MTPALFAFAMRSFTAAITSAVVASSASAATADIFLTTPAFATVAGAAPPPNSLPSSFTRAMCIGSNGDASSLSWTTYFCTKSMTTTYSLTRTENPRGSRTV